MTAGPVGPEALPRRIVLTGFMGAGKSTVGRLLAAHLRWPFHDIDTVIAARERLSVAEIFARHGETYFRRLETEAIASALRADTLQAESAIIALGGGAVESESVRALLFAETSASSAPTSSVPAIVTIFLSAPLSELLARCQPSQQSGLGSGMDLPVRPLLAASEPPKERLDRRLPHYRRAHLTVETSGLRPDAVVDRILSWLSVPGLP